MKPIPIAAALAPALALLFAGGASAASFDCSRHLPYDMRQICDDPGLSQRDDQAADLYRRASQQVGYNGQAALRAQRDGFLRQRGACAGDRRCMYRVYDDQISELRRMTDQGPDMRMSRPNY